MNAQKHVRQIVKKDGEELINKITFYPCITPQTEEEIWKIVEKEFSLLPREKIQLIWRNTGALDVVPDEPQPIPESFLQYPELTVYQCDKPKNVAELILWITRNFPNIPLENLVSTLGIVSISFTQKK